MADIDEAVDRVMGGPAKENHVKYTEKRKDVSGFTMKQDML